MIRDSRREAAGRHYRLFLGKRAFSSWSLRGWLSFRAFGIDLHAASREYVEALPAHPVRVGFCAEAMSESRLIDEIELGHD